VTPSFPALPPDPFGLEDPAVALAAIGRIQRWRDELRAWLARAPEVSARMRALLDEAARGAPDARLGPFPDAPGADPVRDLRAVLVWRARVLHWVVDAWDVIGDDAFGVEECATIEGVLGRPAGACAYCFARDALPGAHFTRCAALRATGDVARAAAVWGAPR